MTFLEIIYTKCELRGPGLIYLFKFHCINHIFYSYNLSVLNFHIFFKYSIRAECKTINFFKFVLILSNLSEVNGNIESTNFLNHLFSHKNAFPETYFSSFSI